MHRAEIFRDGAGGWRYRLLGGNGETIAASESYTRKWSCRRAVRKNHPDVKTIIVVK